MRYSAGLSCSDDSRAGDASDGWADADYLQVEVMDKPDAPASIGEISQAMESERFTRHFAVTVSPKVED